MKTKVYLLVIFIGLLFVCEKGMGQAPEWDWAKKIEGVNYSKNNRIAVDVLGNIYTSGAFIGRVDFDPGPGLSFVTSVGNTYDFFVSKRDSMGNHIWTKQIGGLEHDSVNAITLDVSGNIYITGHFGGTVDFDPGIGVYNLSAVNHDAFILKLDTAGNFVWAKSMGGINANVDANSITLDASGNILTTGYFDGSVDFDPGAGIQMLSTAGGLPNQKDIFISKLDNSGSFIWAERIGGTGNDEGVIIKTDASNNVYTTGHFKDTVDFDPGAGVFNIDGGGMFILKLDNAGNFVWAKATGQAHLTSMIMDAAGNFYSTGGFSGAVDFDPDSAGIFNLTSDTIAHYDIFISKLDNSGNLIWAKRIGSIHADKSIDIALDFNNNVYTVGQFQGAVDFDPDSAGISYAISSGDGDIFISKLNNTGNFIWVKTISGSINSIGDCNSLAIDFAGNIHTTGTFGGIVDFDPDTGHFNLSGRFDSYIQKLDNAGSLVWVLQIAGLASATKGSNDIAIDDNGNVYTAGYFVNTVDFDPGAGTYNLSTDTSGCAAFISKLDPAGNLIWAKSLNGVFTIVCSRIKIGVSGDIYAVGSFYNTADFDPGAGVFNMTSEGSTDIFICKLDSSGNFVWAKRVGGPGYEGGFPCIALDALDNIYITGSFDGTADFNPDTLVDFFITSGGPNDIFFEKLDSSGNFIWAKAVGGGPSGNESSAGIAIDDSANFYSIGSFRGTMDFDPGPATFNLSSNNAAYFDVFILKLDGAGNFVWAKKMGGSSDDWGASIALDSLGNIYSTGKFAFTADYDPDSAGVFNLISAGYYDIFISKLNSSGNFLWARSMGGAESEEPSSLIIDESDNVYTTGTFRETADFDPGIGVFNLTTVLAGYAKDIYISKLDSAGNFVWAKSVGGTSEDYVSSFALNQLGNLHITGSFLSPDLTFGGTNLSAEAMSEYNIYISKLSICTTSSAVDTVACYSYTSPSGNNTWTTSGIYKDTIPNAQGCDSIITIKLVIYTNTTSTVLVNACNSYTSPSGNYTWNTSGTYMDTIANAGGCDSVITINLTIKTSSASSQNITACDNYTSPSGNYNWASSGTYMDTIPNALGCDSIITISLTINPLPVALYTLYPDTITPHNWFALNQCTGTPPLSYVWNWGDSSAVSTGATPSHVYADSGYYNICVTVTDGNGCVNTYCDSSTYIYKGTGNSMITLNVVTQLPNGIDDMDGNSSITISPNPVSDVLTVSLKKPLPANSIITLSDMQGRVVKEEKIAQTNTGVIPINVSALSRGVYLLKMDGVVKRFVKM
ncbi:MAG: SBBP repeat-containing protein [Bacteroidia bacterium]